MTGSKSRKDCADPGNGPIIAQRNHLDDYSGKGQDAEGNTA